MNTSSQRIHDLFDRWLRDEPSRVFLHLPDKTLSFAQVGQLVDQVETEMRADGVLPGDRVLLVAENCPEHVALILACSRIGAWSCGVGIVVCWPVSVVPTTGIFSPVLSAGWPPG